MGWVKSTIALLSACAVLFCGFVFRVSASEEDEPQSREAGCTFRADPAEFLQSQSRARSSVFERAAKLGRTNGRNYSVAAESIPKRNFIDEEILGKLQSLGIPSAPRSSDQEFVRRIHFDLTGRLPSAEDVRTFIENTWPNKREELIEKLLYSPEFGDKWAVWFMDLVSMTEGLSTNARRPRIEGRNSFNLYIRESMSNLKPVRDIVMETITASGNNYYIENGPTNFAVLASAAMGPPQDTYDMMMYRTASAYLGLGHYDCLLCHDGRGHLTGISLWAQRTTRMSAQRMAAHFSRMRLNPIGGTAQYEHPLYNSTDVTDVNAGTYDLNVTFGNRPARCAPGAQPLGRACVSSERTIPATMSLQPEYRDGSPGGNSNWRVAFAEKLLRDPMFGRNFANRLWKRFFNLGLVDPVDTLDPDRLDPKAPPPAPWTMQATHPELLEKLAQFFIENNTDIRAFIRLLVQSSAYQLSSEYSGPWKLEYVTLFARHYPRRLDAEEIHDAIVKASGMNTEYTWPRVNAETVPRGSALPQSEPVKWAMQLPDVNEPRNNAAVRDFMAAFQRGNRDTVARSQQGSMLQQLYLMNDRLVTDRIKIVNSPVLQSIARLGTSEAAVDELFLTFLSRLPSQQERDTAVKYLAQSRNNAERNTLLEDLAWVCINKIEFLYSY
jgi:hypothetical protein